jgi:hypothetical protein
LSDTVDVLMSHRTDGYRVTMRRDPVCSPTDPNWDRAYDQLLAALERLNTKAWQALVQKHRKARKRGLPRFSPCEAAQRIGDQLERLSRCRITPEEATATLHEYGVFSTVYK